MKTIINLIFGMKPQYIGGINIVILTLTLSQYLDYHKIRSLNEELNRKSDSLNTVMSFNVLSINSKMGEVNIIDKQVSLANDSISILKSKIDNENAKLGKINLNNTKQQYQKNKLQSEVNLLREQLSIKEKELKLNSDEYEVKLREWNELHLDSIK